MSIKKLSFVLLSAISLAALLNGCGSSSKEGSPGGVARVASEGVCIVCHAATVDHTSNTNIVADYFASSHNQDVVGCEGCHGGGSQHNGVGPFPYPNPLTADRCITCHTTGGLAPTAQDLTALFARAKDTTGTTHTGFTDNKCAHCHTASGVGSIHAAQVPTISDCIKCHDVAAPNHGAPGLVNDNNGVRAITGEFAKWSHHVTGVTLNAAHCAACHLEGTVVNGQVVVDDTKHMADAKIHLRNADDDSEFAWNPAAPVQADFTGMDNFCMSCHDANGATSPMSHQIQNYINNNGIAAAGKVASPSNPFGDTISNRYDKMQRPAVVDAKDQFDPANNSHHAVRGKRYSGRTRTVGDPRVVTKVTPLAFAANSSALLQGKRSTIFDAGNFNALYVPLGTDGTAATGLGDDSTLHCGDCHTVGQWKVGSSVTANGLPTPAAIGAHGSTNEYLLRNSIGTDERHTQNAYLVGNVAGTVLNPATGLPIPANVVVNTNPNGAFLVCYNCHAFSKYGSVFNATGLDFPSTGGPHAGEYDTSGRCNGISQTLPFNGYTTGKATDGSQFVSRFTGTISANSVPATYPGEQSNDPTRTGFGNIFGIQCANCHNSGSGNTYGGIHGSAKNQNTLTLTVNPAVTGGAYIDGMGNTTKIERFLPGLGNAMHVPGTLGGFTGGLVVPVNTATGPAYTYISGGISNDTNWEQRQWQQTAATVINTATGAVTGGVSAGAGCYTLGGPTAATSVLSGPSVTGAGGAGSALLGTWGGCVDHDAVQGKGDHGFLKRIVRPVTY